jgi:phytoene dehydrogenase-like protein
LNQGEASNSLSIDSRSVKTGQMKRDAVVVGSGPNGLAAAITLAQAGYSVQVFEANSRIGGGTRSAALTLPGFLHDICSAVHPLAAASPFFQQLPLSDFGLDWIQPEIPLAHPFDDGTAACLYRDLDLTAQALGEDAAAYERLMKPVTQHWNTLASEFLQPILHFPQHPFRLAHFGSMAICPATFLARTLFKRETTRALFAGIAAHSFLPLNALMSSAFALVLGGAGHTVGWPIPRGGSQSIADALSQYLHQLGGRIIPDHPIQTLNDLPNAPIKLLDVSTWEFARLAGDCLPNHYRRRLEQFQHAPGVFKIDYALNAPIPWTAPTCRLAGTLHLGGTLPEIVRTENDLAHGKVPARPFVLVAQPSLFDSNRAPRGQHTLWAYCHVPFACQVDMSNAIESQIERFAPGFRDCIIARHQMNSVDLAERNRNLRGGDISGGATTLWQLLARPILSSTPYRTPLPGIYICSASTPPGGGVHGMCGYHAAQAALGDRTKL